jgi:hypothetical protein
MKAAINLNNSAFSTKSSDILVNGCVPNSENGRSRRSRRNGANFGRPAFDPPKCCALHEWPLRRAAPQHWEGMVNVGFGSFVTMPSLAIFVID